MRIQETALAGRRAGATLLVAGCLLALGAGVLPACGDDAQGKLREARALQDAGQFGESIDSLRAVLAKHPDDTQANQLLGMALIQTGQPNRAVFPLEKASESPDYAISAGLLLASTALQFRSYDQALEAVNRVLETDPDRPGALRIRAHANLGLGREEAALVDTQRLIELLPDDYSAHLFHATVLAEAGKLDEAEEVHMRLREIADASDNPSLQARACMALAHFLKDFRKDQEERAQDEHRRCVAAFPTDRLVLSLASEYFDQLGRHEEATRFWKHAVELEPRNLAFRTTYAIRLRGQGRQEEADAVMREGAESLGTPRAWQALADFYRGSGRKAEAVEALDKVEELSGEGEDGLYFVQADLLIDLGELERAEKIASRLEESLYRDLIHGRILLERGDPAGALAAFDRAIRLWPNNAGARYLAGLAARELGDFDRAASELREAVRVDPKANDAALVLARLQFERGRYREASTFARHHIVNRKPRDPQAFVLWARATTALEEYGASRKSLEWLRDQVPDSAPLMTSELASVARAEHGTEAAIAEVRDSGLDLSDPQNEAALRSLTHDLSTLGRHDEAIEQVDRALSRSPEDSSLHELRATLLALAERWDEAESGFRKALELDPENARALGGLATIEARRGRREEAIALFDRAAATDTDEVDFRYAAAQLAVALGHPDAEERLREVVRMTPGHARARNDLAWLLAEDGRDLDLALKLAREARRLEPSPEIIDTLGWVHFRRGEHEEAVRVLEEAAKSGGDSPAILYHLGMALEKAGRTERAIEMLERAIGDGGFPDADAARRELAALKHH